MPFDGNGIYNLPVTTVTPAVAGTTIDDAEFNTFTADLKDALTNCIVKDGQTVSPTLTTPSIVTPTISGTPLVTGNLVINKAEPQLLIKCADEATENSVIRFQDEAGVSRSLLFRPAGADKVRLDARDSLGVTQAALELTEAGDVSVAAGTLRATNAILTTPSLVSPVINTGVSGTAGVSRMIQETAQATTSGTTIDFTSIPSWVKRITVAIDQVSTSAANWTLGIRVGDSGGFEATGYEGAHTIISPTTAAASSRLDQFPLAALVGAAENITAIATLVNITGNVWVIGGTATFYDSGAPLHLYSFSGRKALSGTLDRIQLYADGDTFDAGQVNILYEG